jgi:molybdopterin synthase sulfur carrier subunit
MVTILLFGQVLRDEIGESELQVEVSDSITLQSLIERSVKLSGLVSFMKRGELLVTINRKIGSMDSRVQDGDTVKLTHQSNPVYEGATWHNP